MDVFRHQVPISIAFYLTIYNVTLPSFDLRLQSLESAILNNERLNLATEENEDNIDQLPELPPHCQNVVNSNSGLIPQHFKPYDELDHNSFQCHFCQEVIFVVMW